MQPLVDLTLHSASAAAATAPEENQPLGSLVGKLNGRRIWQIFKVPDDRLEQWNRWDLMKQSGNDWGRYRIQDGLGTIHFFANRDLNEMAFDEITALFRNMIIQAQNPVECMDELMPFFEAHEWKENETPELTLCIATIAGLPQEARTKRVLEHQDWLARKWVSLKKMAK